MKYASARLVAAKKARATSGRKIGARPRVLVADDDTPFARRLADYLRDHGYEVKTVTSISQAKEQIEFWHPDSVFVNLLLPETNALALFKFMHSRNLKKRPRMIVMSKQSLPEGIEQMKRLGASDYLVKPFSLEQAIGAIEGWKTADLVPRTSEKILTQTATPFADLAKRAPAAAPAPKESVVVEPHRPHLTTIKELHLLNLFLRQATGAGTADGQSLYKLMRMIGLKVRAYRCSLIRILNDDTGLVLASNDDENIQGLPVQLRFYPEVTEVARTGRALIIPNVRTSDLMASARKNLQNAPFESIAVFPVVVNDRVFGVLSIRLEQRDPVEFHYVEKFGQVCAAILALAIAAPGQTLIHAD